MVVGGSWQALPLMARHTTFKFCLDPTIEQQEVLVRHAGAAQELTAVVEVEPVDVYADPHKAER
jgi:hypothetical protein